MLPRLSPGGQPTCPSAGSINARVLLVGESPAADEIKQQEPFVGRAGKLLNKSLLRVGLDRADLRITNLVPARAPGTGDKFLNHSVRDMEWGRELLEQEIQSMPNLELIVCLGSNPSEWIQGLQGYGGVTKWRGSLFPRDDGDQGDPDDRYNRYWLRLNRQPRLSIPNVATMATFHPAAVLRQFPWHYWLLNDLRRVRDWLAGEPSTRFKRRRWYVNKPEELDRLADLVCQHEHMVSVDTEMDPQICGLVTDDEVHVFQWCERAREPVTRMMTSPVVLKVAHNMAHDWRQFEQYWGIRVTRPWFDTIGGAHVLEPSGFDPGGDRDDTAGEQMVGKSLSPHISTSFTPWPFHKWLGEVDQLAYCGIDTVVAHDAYWPQLTALQKQPLKMEIAEYDHRLFEVLMDMQRLGVLVDHAARADAEQRLANRVRALDMELEQDARAFVERAYHAGRLEKPHLFRERRVCQCCRNAKLKKEACWSCAGFQKKPGKRELAASGLTLGTCAACQGAGESYQWLPINWDSPDQLKDLFYRAMSIPARIYEGKITTRYEQLAQTLDEGGFLHLTSMSDLRVQTQRAPVRGIVEKYVERAELSTSLATVQRLTPGHDGRLRSVFDPWYTPTGRIASREGLFDVGTNLQNIPKDARRMIVADPGYAFLYPDYAQVEGRAVAVLSEDPEFMRLYSAGTDSHNAVREMMLDLLDRDRDSWKRFNFAALYGIEETHAAEILGCDVLTAMKVLQRYFSRFQGVKRWWAKVEAELRRDRQNTSPTGWQRRWLGYVLHDQGKRRGEVRDKIRKEALATSPQNIGARVLGEGVLALRAAAPWIQPAAHVHDACLYQVPRERMVEAILLAEQHMTVTKWGMTFTVEASLGPNWYVASIGDKQKLREGLVEWTRANVLATQAAA